MPAELPLSSLLPASSISSSVESQPLAPRGKKETQFSGSSKSQMIPSSSLFSLLSSLPAPSSPSPSLTAAFKQLTLTLLGLFISYLSLFHLNWFLLPLGWLGVGISFSVFYLIGVDCASERWTPNPLVNRVVGELVMMPLLQPFEAFKNKIKGETEQSRKKEEPAQLGGSASEVAGYSDSGSVSDADAVSSKSVSPVPEGNQASSFWKSPDFVSPPSFLELLERFLFEFTFPSLPRSDSQARSRLLTSVVLQYGYLALHLSFLYFRHGFQSVLLNFCIPLMFYRFSFPAVRAVFTDLMDAFIPSDVLSTIPSYQLHSFCSLVKSHYQSSYPTLSSDLSSVVRTYASRIHWVNFCFLFVTPVMSIFAFRYITLTLPTLYFSIFYYFVTGVGITAGYHRLFAHKAYEAHPVASITLLLAASGALEGSAKWWCGGHRVHHRYTDTVYDPYNAKGGFWYAHIGWMLIKPKKENQKKADLSDLNANPFIVFQHKHYLIIGPFMAFILPTLIAGLFWGDWLGGYFYAGFVRLLFVNHSTFCVNSVAHYFGDHTFDDRRSPRDNFITAFLTFGEGYHNFHHEFPNDYRNGIQWYDYDPTKWLINLFSAFGIAWNCKMFDGNTIEKGRVAMLEKRVETSKSKLVYPPEKEELNSLFTVAEVESIVKETGRELILYDQIVHDLNGWGAEHPGGKHWIDRHKGKDVARHIDGESGIYFHSEAARRLLATFRIGRLVTEREHKEE